MRKRAMIAAMVTLGATSTLHADILTFELGGTVNMNDPDGLIGGSGPVDWSIEFLIDSATPNSTGDPRFGIYQPLLSFTVTAGAFSFSSTSLPTAELHISDGTPSDPRDIFILNTGFLFEGSDFANVDVGARSSAGTAFDTGALPEPGSLSAADFDGFHVSNFQFASGTSLASVEGSSGAMTLDYLRVVPAPSATALLALGGLAGTRRRR